MANRLFPYTPELKAFQAADDAWGDALRREYGQYSAQARFTRLGRGSEGSELRRLYEARDAAQDAWYASAY